MIAGHGRIAAAKQLGWDSVPTLTIDGLSPEQIKAYILADNQLALNAGWDPDLLKIEIQSLLDVDFNIDLIGFDPLHLDKVMGVVDDASMPSKDVKHNLLNKFLMAPFSILDARSGRWQDRKRGWHNIGISSGDGRSEHLVFGTGSIAEDLGETSIFDPVLCELMYLWFSPENGVVLDPFAGGSVRGIVAAKLNRKYIGIDLSEEQVAANEKQALPICQGDDHMPTWIVGDSMHLDTLYPEQSADFLFSCPPYGNLEKYSNNPRDISNMEYANFKVAYSEIIQKACNFLADDAFACFVVGEFRDRNGNYANFVSDTIKAFSAAGLHYYNELILITALGTLPLRTSAVFPKSRKIGKGHQNVLVFLKGDAKKAVAKLGDVAILDFEDSDA